jgi:hypothetical protein
VSDSLHGYRSGPRTPRPVRIDSSSSAIVVGDFLVLDTAGYYEKAAANGEAQCVAMQACSAGSADGDVIILADFSRDAIYEYPADTGSFVVGDIGKSCDIGGAQSINRDASATGQGGDGCLEILDVDVANNTGFVRLARPAFVGA